MKQNRIKPDEQQRADAERYRLGYTCSNKIRLAEVVDGRFYIFHHQGHQTYISRFSGVQYCPGFHCAIDRKKSEHGHNVFRDPIHKVVGFLTVGKRRELLDAITGWKK